MIACYSVLGHVQDVVEEHSSVKQVKQSQMQPVISSLDECFNLYTKEEQVSNIIIAWQKVTKHGKHYGIKVINIGLV